jgi:hypothetical protein
VSTAVNVDARVKHASVTNDLITFDLVDGPGRQTSPNKRAMVLKDIVERCA